MDTTTTFYFPEEQAFGAKLAAIYDAWENEDRTTRPLSPTFRGNEVRRDLHGVGLTMKGLLLATPSTMQGVPVSVVVIKNGHVEDTLVMAPGTFVRRRAAKGVAEKRVFRSSTGQHNYFDVCVTGESVAAAASLFADILAGRVKPNRAW